jgi:hypothetical protein
MFGRPTFKSIFTALKCFSILEDIFEDSDRDESFFP